MALSLQLERSGSRCGYAIGDVMNALGADGLLSCVGFSCGWLGGDRLRLGEMCRVQAELLVVVMNTSIGYITYWAGPGCDPRRHELMDP